MTATATAADPPAATDPPASPSTLPTATLPPFAIPSPNNTASTRYGWFDLLDHRSAYGTNWFPDPISGLDGDARNEVLFNYDHAEDFYAQDDDGFFDLSHKFGVATLSAGAAYSSIDQTGQGFGRLLH